MPWPLPVAPYVDMDELHLAAGRRIASLLEVEATHVYLHEYDTVMQLEKGLDGYFSFYNDERPHQSLS